MSLLRRDSTPEAGGGMDGDAGGGTEDGTEGGRRSRCRRQLFADDYGQPGATDNLMNVYYEELQRARAAAIARWNFDFKNDRPLKGRWKWEAVGDQQQGEDEDDGGDDEEGEEDSEESDKEDDDDDYTPPQVDMATLQALIAESPPSQPPRPSILPPYNTQPLPITPLTAITYLPPPSPSPPPSTTSPPPPSTSPPPPATSPPPPTSPAPH